MLRISDLMLLREMTSDVGPVLIIVSEDGDHDNSSIEYQQEEKENFSPRYNDSFDRLYDDDPAAKRRNSFSSKTTQTKTLSLSNEHHPPLSKCHSDPLDNRRTSAPQTTLRVPPRFPSYENSSGLYSSNTSFYSNVSDSSTESSYIRSPCIHRKFSYDSDISRRERKGSGPINRCRSTRSISSISREEAIAMARKQMHLAFSNEPLKRTCSAPLKPGMLPHQRHRLANIGPCRSTEDGRSLHIPKGIGKSLSKDDKSGISRSRFSLRRTLSASFWNPNKENSSFEISFPTKVKKKQRQKFRIVEGKTGQSDGISFEVIGKKGTYLRVKGSSLIPDKDSQDSYFNKDCTFVPLPDMWFPSFFSFESVSKPSYFIRLLPNEELVIDKFDGSQDFKMEASFQLTRKPCATCLQVGVKTWAKTASGEYFLGKVTALDECFLTVKFEDGKSEIYSISDTGQYVPDVVPCKDDITVGTRVIAQWSKRDTLFPGVIINVRSNDTYDVLFDDGDSGREKPFQIRLMRSYSFSHIHDPNESHATIVNDCASPSCCTSTQSTPVCARRRSNSKELSDAASLRTTIEQDSTATTDSLSGDAARSAPVNNTNFVISPWELETFSQDSGYQENEKASATASSDIIFIRPTNQHFQRTLLRKQGLPRQTAAAEPMRKIPIKPNSCNSIKETISNQKSINALTRQNCISSSNVSNGE